MRLSMGSPRLRRSSLPTDVSTKTPFVSMATILAWSALNSPRLWSLSVQRILSPSMMESDLRSKSDRQIVRASCREQEGQYVEIYGVHVSLKKKNQYKKE